MSLTVPVLLTMVALGTVFPLYAKIKVADADSG